MYFAGHIKEIKYLSRESLEEIQQKQLSAMLKKYGAASLKGFISKADKETKERFCADLQQNCENAIFNGEA